MQFMLSAIFVFVCALSSYAQLANAPEKAQAPNVVTDTIHDTIYVVRDDGIPWNRDNFPAERLLRHSTFDPALSVAFSYSASFISGSFGSFAQHTYLAHWAYEFSPDLHLYGAVGLWMPLYNNLNFPIVREDARQGRVQPIIPNIGLEYKIGNNSYIRLGIVNEEDVLKAYGPIYRHYGPWRNSNFYP